MNTEKILLRLFALARRAPERAAIELPYGLETAVLAHWRNAVQQRAASNGGLLHGMRWAALLACAIALFAGALERDELITFHSRFDPEARVADSAVADYNDD